MDPPVVVIGDASASMDVAIRTGIFEFLFPLPPCVVLIARHVLGVLVSAMLTSFPFFVFFVTLVVHWWA